MWKEIKKNLILFYSISLYNPILNFGTSMFIALNILLNKYTVYLTTTFKKDKCDI